MTARFLVTNGGPHSPETWAVATAESVFVIGPDVEGARLFQAKRLQMQIAEVLVAHHKSIQETERAALQSDKAARIGIAYEADAAEAKAEADEIIAAIQTVLKDSPWEAQYSNPDTMQAAQTVIASHIMTLKDIERQYSKQ